MKIDKDELKKRLTDIQFKVTQEKGTEKPFTGEYNKFYEEGIYDCIVCGRSLFNSGTKFDSGCGWPAFYDVFNTDNVTFTEDNSFGMKRVEVNCKCGSHLGHVFNDGPSNQNNGTRHCINSASLKFKKKE